MHPKKWLLLVMVLLGGSAVLASYIIGALRVPNAAQVLWGGIPRSIQPVYTVNMFLGAAGFFAFTYFILFRLDPRQTRVTSRFGFELFNLLYLLILIPSALWLPLTFEAAEQSSQLLAWAARLALILVGAASLGLLFALRKAKPTQPLWAHRLALLGSVFFCIQTILLDAIIWGSSFRV